MTVAWGMHREGGGRRTQDMETKIRRMSMLKNGDVGSRLCG